jgi:DNA-binding NarL/FixJ family response regulator
VSRTVLIVDDHASFRRLARRLFEEAGFEVVGEASDGRSAVAAARELAPDLVLLDVMLPDLSGLEVARMLDSLPPPMSVLLVSSRSAEDLGVTVAADGHRFLRKDELSLERLREVFVGER